GRKEDDNAAIKDSSTAELTVFNDEEVTMTMAQTLIKIKAKKARLLDEQMAKRLHDEKLKQAAAREKQEEDDLEKAKVLQKKKYQSLKRKLIYVAEARKNMIVYLKNMAGYKIEHFKCMTYDKKRVAEETLLWESFKELKAVKVLEKDYTLSNGVMTLMLSIRLQVEEDSEMARDLVKKIFMKANQPKNRIADKLELPEELSNVHNTFHISNLKKCLSDESLIIPIKELQLDDKLNFVEEPMEIMDREIQQLRQSHIPIVKVRRNSNRGPKFTWECKDEIRAKYPHLFSNITSSSN
nr:putative reverse transcriptase domain-containing protein [Tanacetum cinerariifolium]